MECVDDDLFILIPGKKARLTALAVLWGGRTDFGSNRYKKQGIRQERESIDSFFISFVVLFPCSMIGLSPRPAWSIIKHQFQTIAYRGRGSGRTVTNGARQPSSSTTQATQRSGVISSPDREPRSRCRSGLGAGVF